jgi:hypothetical protein
VRALADDDGRRAALARNTHDRVGDRDIGVFGDDESLCIESEVAGEPGPLTREPLGVLLLGLIDLEHGPDVDRRRRQPLSGWGREQLEAEAGLPHRQHEDVTLGEQPGGLSEGALARQRPGEGDQDRPGAAPPVGPWVRRGLDGRGSVCVFPRRDDGRYRRRAAGRKRAWPSSRNTASRSTAAGISPSMTNSTPPPRAMTSSRTETSSTSTAAQCSRPSRAPASAKYTDVELVAAHLHGMMDS